VANRIGESWRTFVYKPQAKKIVVPSKVSNSRFHNRRARIGAAVFVFAVGGVYRAGVSAKAT
jgi:hypothetical protein